MFLQVFVASVFLVANVDLLSLPSYITPCSLSDPEFEKCATATAKKFFQQIATNGDPDLKIPSLINMRYPILYFNNSKDISLNVSNAEVQRLHNFDIVGLKKLPGKNRIEAVFLCDVKINGDYALDSTFGGVTVSGSGRGAWEFDEVIIDIIFEWQPKERDGVKYTEVTNLEATMRAKEEKFSIDGDNINELLSPVLDQFLKELLPVNENYAKRIFHRFTNVLFTSVPYDELFLE